MNARDYEYLSSFLLGTSGLALGEGKEYLLEARLIPLAQSLGYNSIAELVQILRKRADDRLIVAITEAMTTNETSFFRDKILFEELKATLLPAVIHRRTTKRSVRIWCAACSTGQEPYSLAMLLTESFPELKGWTIDILATDIDKTALKRAVDAVYSQFEVQRGLPVQSLMKYFEQVPGGWQINKEIRSRIKFQPLNLLDNFSSLGTFDFIFCRNVLMYFQDSTKRDILDRMAEITAPDGYLLMGAVETVLGISQAFERFRGCRSAVYKPMAKAGAR